ncbi:hypothetical protein [Austwickia chelonae]|nr:hypothetical protein [Austwickia chelonae]
MTGRTPHISRSPSAVGRTITGGSGLMRAAYLVVGVDRASDSAGPGV